MDTQVSVCSGALHIASQTKCSNAEFECLLNRQWAVFLAKILLKSEQACAKTIIFAAIDFSLQNVSGVYLS